MRMWGVVKDGKSKCEESRVKIVFLWRGSGRKRMQWVSWHSLKRKLFCKQKNFVPRICKLFEIHSLYIPTRSKIELLLPLVHIWRTFL